MKIIIGILFTSTFFVCNFSVLLAQWETQESKVNVNLYEICFVDSMNGWILGTNTTILSTNDGGSNWVQQFVPIDDTIKLSCIEFVNTMNGFIIGENGLILSTMDGGITWLKKENEYNYDFSDLSFVNENKGWLTGSLETDTTRETVIFHTIDGGNTWTKQHEIFDNIFFDAIEFLNDSVGWACGGNHLDGLSSTDIYMTENGGNSWNKISVFELPSYDLKIASTNTVWVVGPGPFGISNDSGKTWDYHPINDPIYTISPINDMEGWIFSLNRNTNVKRILYTIDGGEIWNQELELETFILDMENYNGKVLWIVGEDGLIMRRKGHITSVLKNNNVQQRFYLSQNYPNPFNPTTVIRYSIPNVASSFSSRIEIRVYDILGKHIKTLINKVQPAGNYEVEFDAENLPSGIYIYKLKTDHITKSRKMVFLK